MKIEHNLTDFNTRVQNLQAVTGKSQGEIAALLEVSRTTLHYYCTGQNSPKAAALYRLERAERQAGDRPLPPTGGTTEFADGRPRNEGELTRHLRWLRDARQTAQTHLRELDGWIEATETALADCRRRADEGEVSDAKTGRKAAVSGEKPRLLRDIDTVSLPIFGALPAGWPQTREGVRRQRPVRRMNVRRGQFPEGAFGLEVRGDSMNAARPTPVLDGDVVVLLSPEQREPQAEDIVAALIDGETCLKRLKTRRGSKGAFLKSESTNPAHGEIYPAHDLVIQGVLVGKL